MALESKAEVESLQKVIYQGRGMRFPYGQASGKTDAGEQVLNRLMLEELLESLPKEERRLLYLRYFQEETQSRIAERMGISQVQVSRLEKKILQKLKKKAESR